MIVIFLLLIVFIIFIVKKTIKFITQADNKMSGGFQLPEILPQARWMPDPHKASTASW